MPTPRILRTASPCVGEIGDSPLESDFFDVDPGRGVHVTLMAHEVVFIPFTFLSLEPRRPAPPPPPLSSPSKRTCSKGGGDRTDESRAFERAGALTAERSVVVAFVSASHGHVVSIMQVSPVWIYACFEAATQDAPIWYASASPLLPCLRLFRGYKYRDAGSARTGESCDC